MLIDYSTEGAGAAGRKWEASVGSQARTQLASLMEDKQTAAERNERFQRKMLKGMSSSTGPCL